jgi:hypothetical protein
MGLLTNSVFARAATVSLQGILSLPDPAFALPRRSSHRSRRPAARPDRTAIPAVAAIHPAHRGAPGRRPGFPIAVGHNAIRTSNPRPLLSLLLYPHHIDPRVSLLRETQLSGLGPTWVHRGIRSIQGRRSRLCGTPAVCGIGHASPYLAGLLHGFANFIGPDRAARTALREIAETLSDALVHSTGQRARATVDVCAA